MTERIWDVVVVGAGAADILTNVGNFYLPSLRPVIVLNEIIVALRA